MIELQSQSFIKNFDGTFLGIQQQMESFTFLNSPVAKCLLHQAYQWYLVLLLATLAIFYLQKLNSLYEWIDGIFFNIIVRSI